MSNKLKTSLYCEQVCILTHKKQNSVISTILTNKSELTHFFNKHCKLIEVPIVNALDPLHRLDILLKNTL